MEHRPELIWILKQPVDQSVVAGSPAAFTVVADGRTPLLRYQWKRNGVTVGGNTTTLSLPAAQPSDRGAYTVTISSPAWTTTSKAVSLFVNTPPVITSQPQGLTVDVGGTATFTVAATEDAGGTLSYQWRRGGEPISGATSPVLTLASVSAIDAGTYDVVVTNTLHGTRTTAISAGAVLLVHLPPAITVQPQTQTVQPPDAVTFRVVAEANLGGMLSYQWKKNGTPIDGATGLTYTVGSTEFPTNIDTYSVEVRDGALTTESVSVNALASVDSPVFAGNPVPVPARPVTVLNSFHVDPVAFPNGAFRLGYDESLKDPVWSAYVVFPVRQPYPNSDGDYTPDPRLDAPQVGKNDYTGIYTGGASSPTSYDRGHMVPRADVSYRYTPVAGDDATMMSNLVPQISQFNQQTWQRLETAIGGTRGGTMDGLTSTKGRVWVYTGSVFPSGHAWWNSQITPGLRIGIPTACWKIVVSEQIPGQPKVLAVLMPNAWGMVNEDATLTNYVTSVARIEALTGLDFFPGMAAKVPGLDIPTWKATVDVRGWRAPFEQANGPNVHMIAPSWDQTINANDTVHFEGATTPSASTPGATIAATTWTFGDGTPAVTGTTATHTYTRNGSYQATFTATDSLGMTNTLSRIIRVTGGNEAPTMAVIPAQTATSGSPLTVKFTVTDDRTPAGSLALAASAEDATLIPGPFGITNSGGAITLVFTPAAGLTGKTQVTVTATDAEGASTSRTFAVTVQAAQAGFTEAFESSGKSAYAAGNITLPSGTWNLDDALIGNTTSDRRNGTWSVRARNLAKVTMGFDVPTGAKGVSLYHAKYGSDANSNWQLWQSTNGGAWIQVSGDIATTTTTLEKVTIPVVAAGPVRFQIRKVSGGSARINFDDFQVVAN